MKLQPHLVMPMPVCYARVIASGLGLNESDCIELLLGSGLAPEDLKSDDRYVSFEQQRHIVLNAFRISGDHGIGLHIGAMAPLSTHGALGYAALSSQDLQSALEIFLRYSATRAGFFRMETYPHEDELQIAIHELTDLGSVKRFMHEILVLTFKALLDTAIGPNIAGLSVDFAYPEPEYGRRYASALAMPVRFDAPVTLFRIPVSLLSRRCVTANKKSLEIAERQCQQELAALSAQLSFSAMVLAAVSAQLEQGCTQEGMARHFRLSTRTLIRRLAEEGGSFRKILDQARMQAAQRYLLESDQTISDIASRLGYRDPSNLGRAVRGWFGMSPSDYRLTRAQ